MCPQKSIRQKLALSLWAATLLAFAIAGAGLALYQNLTMKDRARQIMEPYAHLVSVGTDAAVAFEDPVRAQQILDTLRANPQILEAGIYLEDGRVLARFSSVRGGVAWAPADQPPGIYLGSGRIELLQALQRGARLRLVMSLDQLSRQMHQTLWLFGAAGLILFVVTFGLLAVLQRTITRPIATLAEAAEGVRTRADYDQRVPAAGNDEIARLGQGFNAMLTAVRDREHDLRRVTLFQRTLLDNAAYAIISATGDGTVTSFNPAAERLTGYPAAEVVGQATPLLWHDPEEVAQRARELAEELGEAVVPGFEVFAARARRNLGEENEWTFIRKDGTRVPVLLSVTALRDEQGELTGFVGLVSDLSERKRADEELRRSRAALSEAQRIGEIGSWEWDTVHDRIWCSDEYVRLYGFKPGSPPPSYAEHLKAFTPESAVRLDAAVKLVLEGGEPCELDLELARPTPTTCWIVVRCEGNRDANGAIRGLRGTAQNITGRKRADEEVRRLNESLERRVAERTAELEGKNVELEGKNAELGRLNKLFVGRELRMVELKEKIRELESKS